MGKAIDLLVKFVCLLVVLALAYGGWYLFQRYSDISLIKTNIRRVYDNPHDEKARQEIYERFQYFPAACDDMPQHSINDDTMAKIIRESPERLDLTPLLTMPKLHEKAYDAAAETLVKRKGKDWVIVRSCNKAPVVRHIAARALMFGLPFNLGKPEDENTLAQEMTPPQKSEVYEKIYEKYHRRVERSIIGTWCIQLDGIWQTNLKEKQTVFFRSRTPYISVTCEKRLFSIKFFRATWDGNIDQLRDMKLSWPLSKVAGDLTKYDRYRLLEKTKATLTISADHRLQIALAGYPTFDYQSSRSGNIKLVYVDTMRAGYSKLDCTAVRP